MARTLKALTPLEETALVEQGNTDSTLLEAQKQLNRIVELQNFLAQKRAEYEKQIASAEVEMADLQARLQEYMKNKRIQKLESQFGIALWSLKTRTEKHIDVVRFIQFFKTQPKGSKLEDYIHVPSGRVCKDFGEKVLVDTGALFYQTQEKEVFEVKPKV